MIIIFEHVSFAIATQGIAFKSRMWFGMDKHSTVAFYYILHIFVFSTKFPFSFSLNLCGSKRQKEEEVEVESI